jgi:hypothetical protein
MLHCSKAPQALSAARSDESYQLIKQNRHVPAHTARDRLRPSDQWLGDQSRQIRGGALTPP